MNIQKQAFTLVELSIVLVILGLLIGGVLTGQSLIRAAELRAVTTEYTRYVTATQTFRDKYFALPGDMTNATQYWGRETSNADCVTNSAAAVNGTAGVCDGSGNGLVIWSNAGATGTSVEMHQYWRQLATAGLIEGSYTGLGGPASTSADVVPGTNAPKSKLGNGAWGVGGTSTGTAQTFTLPSGYGNYLTFGAVTTNNNPISSVLKTEEAYNIDTKIDDGKPATGKLVALYGTSSSGCTSSASVTDLTGVYNLNSTVIQCSLYFHNAF